MIKEVFISSGLAQIGKTLIEEPYVAPIATDRIIFEWTDRLEYQSDWFDHVE